MTSKPKVAGSIFLDFSAHAPPSGWYDEHQIWWYDTILYQDYVCEVSLRLIEEFFRIHKNCWLGGFEKRSISETSKNERST